MSSWDDPPRRDDPPREVAPHRSRKNRRKWCRGKVGVRHVLGQPTLKSWAQAAYGRRVATYATCHWVKWSKAPYWICHHEIKCTTCGKIMQHWIPKTECPNYQPQP